MHVIGYDGRYYKFARAARMVFCAGAFKSHRLEHGSVRMLLIYCNNFSGAKMSRSGLGAQQNNLIE